MPEDGYRRELVRGQLLVSPSPVARHQLVVKRLLRLLDDARPEALEVLCAPFDWKHSDDTVLVPDLVVFRRSDLDLDGPLRATPLLVVEVWSPSTALTDRTLKRAVYEEAGVGAYWRVDPVEPRLAVLELGEDRRYAEVAEVEGEGRFTASFPFPVTVVPAALLS
jgi:Uma2 family endonuclease